MRDQDPPATAGGTDRIALKFMWDTKRQIIWLATGFIVGTFVLYHDSFDEDGTFSRSFFLFLEFLLLLIMSVLFYVYSRKSKG